jgi:hypothetical protein
MEKESNFLERANDICVVLRLLAPQNTYKNTIYLSHVRSQLGLQRMTVIEFGLLLYGQDI